jgi:hypothetical protein
VRPVGWLVLFGAAVASLGYVWCGDRDDSAAPLASYNKRPTPPPHDTPITPPLPPPSIVSSFQNEDEDAGVEDAGGCATGLVMSDETINQAGERARGCIQRVDGYRVKEGMWHIYAPNGQSMAGVYEHGRRQGTWTAWYANGDVLQTIDFVNDEKSGMWIQWGEDGRKVFEKEYRDGVQDGRAITYLQDGGVIVQMWVRGEIQR